MLVGSRLVRVDRVTLVELNVPSLEQHFAAVSILHPDDTAIRDEEIGRLLAYGRAYERLSRYLIRQANGRVKMLENQRKSKGDSGQVGC